MKNCRKLSVILSLCLVCSSFFATVFALEETTTDIILEDSEDNIKQNII